MSLGFDPVVKASTKVPKKSAHIVTLNIPSVVFGCTCFQNWSFIPNATYAVVLEQDLAPAYHSSIDQHNGSQFIIGYRAIKTLQVCVVI